MIELRNDRLVFSFPEVHPGARFAVGFQRTLRIPMTVGSTRCRRGWAGSRCAMSMTTPTRCPRRGWRGVG